MRMKNVNGLVLAFFLLANFKIGFSQQQKTPPAFHALVLAERGGIHEGFVVAALEWLNQYSIEQHFDFHVINRTDSISSAYSVALPGIHSVEFSSLYVERFVQRQHFKNMWKKEVEAGSVFIMHPCWEL